MEQNLKEQTIKEKYAYWEWRTLILLMIGYALFYFVRKNFSIVMPALEAELGISKTRLGLFLTMNGIIYGVSRFINGFLADRVSRRKMMATGLLLSAVVNLFIGLSPEMDGLFHFLDAEGKATMGLVVFIGSLWLINGYTQGMGYPPCGALMAQWIKPSELALKQSVWNSSHSIGAGLVALLCGTVILKFFGYESWQWCFYIPAILAIFGAAMLFFGLRDDPASVGLPDPEQLDEHLAGKEVESESKEFKDLAYKRLVGPMVFQNRYVWILALTNVFVYVIRFTILDWGSTFLTQYKGLPISKASVVVALSEIAGGIIGTLLAGFATDKFFKGKSHQTYRPAWRHHHVRALLDDAERVEWSGRILHHHGEFLRVHAPGAYRRGRFEPEYQAGSGLQQWRDGHFRLCRHRDFGCGIRCPGRQCWRMGCRFPCSHHHGLHRIRHHRHHVEGAGQRIR